MENSLGVFDSGSGGLFVLKYLRKELPWRDILYLGDLGNFPYGEKDKEVLRKIVENNIDFLKKKGARDLVIACNTATSVIFEDLSTFFVGACFDVIRPTLKEAMSCTKTKKVGLVATSNTVGFDIYTKLFLDKGIELFTHPMPGLATLVEESLLQEKELLQAFSSFFEKLPSQVDTIILGCTHYSFFKGILERHFPKFCFLDSSAYVHKEILRHATGEENREKKGCLTIFTTGSSVFFEKKIEEDFPDAKIIWQDPFLWEKKIL